MKLLEDNSDEVTGRQFGCSCWTLIGRDVATGRRLKGTAIGRVVSGWGLEGKTPTLLEDNSDAVAGSELDVTGRGSDVAGR